MIRGHIRDTEMSLLERARSSLVRFFFIAYLREEGEKTECDEKALLPKYRAQQI